jgi:uncharacterized protein YvpB
MHSRATRRTLRFAAIVAATVAIGLTAIPADAATLPHPVLLHGYVPARQTEALTCEAAATSMATRGVLSENAIMARLPRNANPNLGFRGDPAGPYIIRGLPNYGVYPDALASVLATSGWSSIPVYDATRYGLERYLNFGWPVVVWISYGLSAQTPYRIREDHRSVLMVAYEHAVLAVGFTATDVIVNDPYSGVRSTYDWADFMRSWNYLGRMALAVRPCLAPPPVGNITATRLPWRVTWSWSAVARARSYGVWIYIRHGSIWMRSKHLVTSDTTFTTHGATPAMAYRIRVEGVAPCGTLGHARYAFAPPTE